MRSESQLKSEFRAALEAVTPPAPHLAATVHESLRARQRGRLWDLAPRELRIGLNAVAILLLIALAIATMGVFLALHRSTVPARHGVGSVIVPFKMFSPTTGWGLAANAIVRTTDGGIYWTDVSPPGWERDYPYPLPPKSDFFLDSDRAWVTKVSATSPQIVFFRTTDGGRTWQQIASIVDAGLISSLPLQLDFIDPLHGWFMGPKPGPALGLYSTDDGGEHWNPVAVHSGPQDAGCTGMAFISVSTGWIVCNWNLTVGVPPRDRSGPAPATPPVFSDASGSTLLVTHDGGVTWVDQPLPVPPRSQGLFDPPVFFDQAHGIIELDLADLETLLVTSDGGATWSRGSLPGTPPLARGPADFIDATHGWVVAGSSPELGKNLPDLSLYRTDDGGANWVRVQADLPWLSNDSLFRQLYFVNEEIGFAVLIATDTGMVPFQLLKTTDGGQTWIVVAKQ
jgi:photosystem II stability/assembly factor-like uncharacterized protein